MGKPRLFSTAPITAMQDGELTGLDWRVLLWVSLHDGMSLLKEKGAGCYASNLTLFAEVGCEYSAGCRSLSKLVARGHLKREQVGRSTRYRVIFGTPNNLQAGNISPPKRVAGWQAETPEHVAEQLQQNHDNAGEQGLDYSPLSGELDSVETGELNSSEEAHLCDARFPPEGNLSASAFGIDLSAHKGKETAEAGFGSRMALAPHLPRNFASLPLGAQVARLDQAYTKIGRDPDSLDSRSREALTDWLGEIFDNHMGGELDAVAQQAGRLRDDMYVW